MTTVSTEDAAAAFISRNCFKTGPSRKIGVELEWLVHPSGDLETAWDLPFGSAVTREAGGQVELSSPPADDLASCITRVETDQAALESALAGRGQSVRSGGFDGFRDEPVRFVDSPRYRAMEAFYGRKGPWGLMVLCSTASIQVNLDAGDDGDGPSGLRRRWDLVHRLGPVLVAAFANSPLLEGSPSGWKSTRQLLWSRIDPWWTRRESDSGDLRRDYAEYVLDAEVMCVRREPPAPWTAPRGLTMRSWIRDGVDGARPTEDDIEYHMTTLFPPVRPRGWMELRMIDQQEGDGWIMPTVVAATLMDDPVAAETAYEATEALCGGRARPPWEVWMDAARSGVSDPKLRAVAETCFDATAEALRRTEAPPRLQKMLSEFRHRYLDRGRCPADDLLDRVETGDPVPLTMEAPS